jgi:hypothetical protein
LNRSDRSIAVPKSKNHVWPCCTRSSYWPTEVHVLQQACRTSQHSQHYTIAIPSARKDCRKWSFFVNTVRDWNNLPPDITSAASLEMFKAQVNQHFHHWIDCFYPVFNHMCTLTNWQNIQCVEGGQQEEEEENIPMMF